MLFVHVMERLLYGELSSLNFARNMDTSDISDRDLKRMIAFTNEALSDIYSRIPIDTRSLVIDSEDNISSYLLTPDFALSNDKSTEPVKYIRDSKEHPFTGDVLKILEVFDECGRRIPLNDESFSGSVFTPYHNVLMITHPTKGKSYEVVYSARPSSVEYKSRRLEIADQEVQIPLALEEALLLKIASRFFIGMSGQEVSNKYMDMITRYETILQMYHDNNLIDTTRLSDTHRLKERGFI